MDARWCNPTPRTSLCGQRSAGIAVPAPVPNPVSPTPSRPVPQIHGLPPLSCCSLPSPLCRSPAWMPGGAWLYSFQLYGGTGGMMAGGRARTALNSDALKSSCYTCFSFLLTFRSRIQPATRLRREPPRPGSAAVWRPAARICPQPTVTGVSAARPVPPLAGRRATVGWWVSVCIPCGGGEPGMLRAHRTAFTLLALSHLLTRTIPPTLAPSPSRTDAPGTGCRRSTCHRYGGCPEGLACRCTTPAPGWTCRWAGATIRSSARLPGPAGCSVLLR